MTGAEKIVAAAIAEEREACIECIREKIGEVKALAARGRIPANDATMLTRRLDAIADEIGQGLHR